MENVENVENTQPNNKIYTYLLALLFVVFIGSGVFLLLSNKNQTAKKEEAAISMTQKEESTETEKSPEIPSNGVMRGSLLLNKKSEFALVNNNFSLDLLADSVGENVSAFDVIISYDPLSIEFVSAQSNNPSFKVYSYKKDNRLTLTVVKTSLGSEASVFQGESLITLDFMPKSKGEFIFKILPSYDVESTKFVNEKTQVIYPEVNEVTVSVN